MTGYLLSRAPGALGSFLPPQRPVPEPRDHTEPPITTGPALGPGLPPPGSGHDRCRSCPPPASTQRATARQLRMAARPAAVPQARAIVRELLREWQLDAMADEVTLLLSELMTNAVQACTAGPDGPEIVATIRLAGTVLLLEIWDASPAPPVVQEADLTSESGRGLLMIEVMSTRWGHHQQDGGKVVWCEVALPG